MSSSAGTHSAWRCWSSSQRACRPCGDMTRPGRWYDRRRPGWRRLGPFLVVRDSGHGVHRHFVYLSSLSRPAEPRVFSRCKSSRLATTFSQAPITSIVSQPITATFSAEAESYSWPTGLSQYEPGAQEAIAIASKLTGDCSRSSPSNRHRTYYETREITCLYFPLSPAGLNNGTLPHHLRLRLRKWVRSQRCV